MKKNQAFTLIELMVVITIMGIIMFASYIPYEFHQKKTALRVAAREVSQSLSDARNLAIHGLDSGSGNLSVGLYFASGATQIEYYAYPYTLTMNTGTLDTAYKIRSKKLPRGVNVYSIAGAPQDYFISFGAIHGSGAITEDTVSIILSYGNSNDAVLQREVTFYTQTHISDY